jgi:hypothetical protein
MGWKSLVWGKYQPSRPFMFSWVPRLKLHGDGRNSIGAESLSAPHTMGKLLAVIRGQPVQLSDMGLAKAHNFAGDHSTQMRVVGARSVSLTWRYEKYYPTPAYLVVILGITLVS